jgi:hypothetical protein
VRFLQPAPATGTNQLPIPSLAPYPQSKRFALLIDFMAVDPVSGPPQQFRQFTVSQTAEFTEMLPVNKSTPA